TSAFPGKTDWRPHRELSGFDARSAPRQSVLRIHPEIRSSREIYSSCRHGVTERELFLDRRPSAPVAASPKNLCRLNTASPGAKTPRPLPAGYKYSRLQAPLGGSTCDRKPPPRGNGCEVLSQGCTVLAAHLPWI